MKEAIVVTEKKVPELPPTPALHAPMGGGGARRS